MRPMGDRIRGVVIAWLLLSSASPGQFQLYEFQGPPSLGSKVRLLQDANGDGFADIYARDPRTVFSGKDGSSIDWSHGGDPIGDLNADGYEDYLIVVAGSCSDCRDAVIHSGSDQSQLFVIHFVPNYGHEVWGFPNYSVGDVNGDGITDIAIVDEVHGLGFNLVFVYSGADGMLLYELRGYNPRVSPTSFGRYLASEFDVDGDGCSDLVIGDNYLDVNKDYSTDGLVDVYSGKSGTLLYRFLGPGTFWTSFFGSFVAGLGDLNADGRDEFCYMDASRRIQVINGSDGSPLFGPIPGNSACRAPDLDGDGNAELVLFDYTTGNCLLFSAGLVDFTISMPELLGKNGTLEGGKDVNRDGTPDFVLGAPDVDIGGQPTGLVRAFALCHKARFANYGSGYPGTLGIPSISLNAPPVMGSTVLLELGNSLGAATIGVLFIGPDPADIDSSWGGDLLVASRFPPVLIPLGPAGGSIPLAVPDNLPFCGLALYWQILESDPGAAHGVSFSPGLEIVLGR